jgi:3-hydroxybutyryl-CoA dehydratase
MKTIFIKQKFSLIRKFSKEDVIIFSELSGDKNPLHLNEEFASKSIFKKPICHGMMGTSLFSNLMGNYITGAIYISQNVNFLKPIFIEEEIEATVEIKDFNKEKNILYLATYVKKIEKNQIAIDGEANIKIPDNYIVNFNDMNKKNNSNNDNNHNKIKV